MLSPEALPTHLRRPAHLHVSAGAAVHAARPPDSRLQSVYPREDPANEAHHHPSWRHARLQQLVRQTSQDHVHVANCILHLRCLSPSPRPSFPNHAHFCARQSEPGENHDPSTE